MSKSSRADDSDSKLAAAGHQVSEAATAAAKAASDAAHAATKAATDAALTARERAGETISLLRDRAGDAYEAARDTAASARDTGASALESSPLALVAGGLALGAIVAALLPRTDRESDILGPLATRAADAAKLAFAAAKDAGQVKLDELGVNREAARAKVDQLLSSASEAVTSAGSAARDAVRSKDA